jgi:hypothetical protein
VRRRTEWIAAAAVAMPALAYIVWKGLFDRSDTVDFKYMWLAGHLWSQGIDAYGPAFRATGDALFVGLNPPQTLFYPPNLWPVATAAATLPYPEAIPVWRAVSAALLLAGPLVLILRGPVAPLRAACALAFVAAGTPAAVALSLGQTSPLILAGTGLWALAFLRRDRAAMALAVAVVVLKPSFGVLMAAFLLADRHWWPSIAAAALASLAAAAPVMIAHGPVATVGAWLGAVAAFDEHMFNQPHSITGLRNLVDWWLGRDIPPLALMAAGVPLMALAGRRAGQGAAAAGLAVALAVLLAPMHTYDAVLLAPLILLVAPLPVAVQAVVGVALLAVFREANLAQVTGFLDPAAIHNPGTRIVSLAALAATLALLAATLRADARRP